MNAAANTVSRYETFQLRRVMDVLETEMAGAMAGGVKGTQAHVGQIEMLQAVSAELARRQRVA